MHTDSIKLVLTAAVVAVAIFGGWPAIRAGTSKRDHAGFGWGEAFAAGIFLGAGLIHMLGDAQSAFDGAKIDYPYAMVICGAVMLMLLWLEHLSAAVEAASAQGAALPGKNRTVALTALLMLSVHSVLMGAAFGVSTSLAVTVALFIAVLAHKGAASFALALELGRAGFSQTAIWKLFLVFVAMFPVGVALGQIVSAVSGAHPLVEASIVAAAAGTFLFFGTLHGLASSAMIVRCCNSREFLGAVAGFAVMAVVAVWT